MPVRVGTAIFDDWKAMEYPPAGWTDTFILVVRHDEGLPPGDFAEGLKKLFGPLRKLRPGASVWVKVDAPGEWYAREVRRVLRGTELSIAVTYADVIQPKAESYSFPPYTIKVPSGPPPDAEPMNLKGLSDEPLACLRVLARVGTAYTAEVSALTGIGMDRTRKLLRSLLDQGFTEYIADHVTPAAPKPRQMTMIGEKAIARKNPEEKKSYPFWKVTRTGTSIALRSWGLPPEYQFSERREHRTPMDSRHRRVSRQWPAWVRKAWPHAEVWAGWSEVRIKGLAATPDALAWGLMGGYESLFWLEVESGHASRELIQKKLARRLSQATAYAESLKVRLVFVLLAMPWVQEAARTALVGISDTTACLAGTWSEFGKLPVAEWGRVRLEIDVPK